EEADIEDIDPSRKFPEGSSLDYCDNGHETNSSQESLYESFQNTANDVTLSQEIQNDSEIDLVGNMNILSNGQTDVIREMQRLTGQPVENTSENEDLQDQENANKHSLLYILGGNQLSNSCQSEITSHNSHVLTKEISINPNEKSNDKILADRESSQSPQSLMNKTDIMQSVTTPTKEVQFNPETLGAST
ncbi:7630_t:CDS:1, partial [Racocetra fulgida]